MSNTVEDERTTTDLDRSPGVLQPARYGFAPEQVKAIKATVAKDCSDAELVVFLEICGRYGLDPFAKQAYAAKMRGGVQVIVSRDGLLAIAHRSPDFRRMEGDVVRENDEFRVEFDGGERRVSHTYSQAKDRGPIVGAWTIVEREGHGQTYFYADMSEYGRDTDVWKRHTSAMILKVAETYALRKAFSISGVVGEEEIGRQGPDDRSNLTATPVEPEWGDDDLGEEIRALVDEAREVEPSAWRPQKVATLLRGADDDARSALAAELISVLSEASEPVLDAEVVE